MIPEHMIFLLTSDIVSHHTLIKPNSRKIASSSKVFSIDVVLPSSEVFAIEIALLSCISEQPEQQTPTHHISFNQVA